MHTNANKQNESLTRPHSLCLVLMPFSLSGRNQERPLEYLRFGISLQKSGMKNSLRTQGPQGSQFLDALAHG